MVQGTDGSLYGTTEEFVSPSAGNVFKITTQGEIQTLYTFCLQQNCISGEYPLAGVIQGIDGDFYGTTSDGGANTYYGTIFKVASKDEVTLHSFDSTDGANPSSRSHPTAP